jgi:hypothetical protein
MSRLRLLVLLVVLVAPFAAANAAASGPEGSERYQIVVGEEGPQMELIVDIGLLANFGTAGELGVTTVGTLPAATTAEAAATHNETVLRSRFGVDFAGVGDPVAFAANPFSRVTGHWNVTMNLPFDDAPGAAGTYDYRDNGTVTGEQVNESATVTPTAEA